MNLHRKTRIPKEAKLAFRGEIFETWQWKQKMFDGSFETFEMLKRTDTVMGICVTTDQKILVTNESQPNKPNFKSLPRGRMETGESPEEAVLREVLEETGYIGERVTLFLEEIPFSKIDWVVYHFVIQNCTPKQEQHLDNGEMISLQKLDFENFIEFVTSKDFSDQGLKNYLLRAKLDGNLMKDFKENILGLS